MQNALPNPSDRKIGNLPWRDSLPVFSLAVHFLALYPAIHFSPAGRDWPWIGRYGYDIWRAMVILYIILRHAGGFDALGLGSKQALQKSLWGLLPGIGIFLSLPLLDHLLSMTPLAREELFAESVNTARATPLPAWHEILYKALLSPLCIQLYFFGLTQNTLKQKLKSAQAVFVGGLICWLGLFDISMGGLIMALVSAGLYQHSGGIYAGWAWQAATTLAGMELLHAYPRLSAFFLYLY